MVEVFNLLIKLHQAKIIDLEACLMGSKLNRVTTAKLSFTVKPGTIHQCFFQKLMKLPFLTPLFLLAKISSITINITLSQ